jgi:hypothetical protein
MVNYCLRIDSKTWVLHIECVYGIKLGEHYIKLGDTTSFHTGASSKNISAMNTNPSCG